MAFLSPVSDFAAVRWAPASQWSFWGWFWSWRRRCASLLSLAGRGGRGRSRRACALDKVSGSDDLGLRLMVEDLAVFCWAVWLRPQIRSGGSSVSALVSGRCRRPCSFSVSRSNSEELVATAAQQRHLARGFFTSKDKTSATSCSPIGHSGAGDGSSCVAVAMNTKKIRDLGVVSYFFRVLFRSFGGVCCFLFPVFASVFSRMCIVCFLNMNTA